MKKTIAVLIVAALFVGCASFQKTTTTEYDANGKVTKVTKTELTKGASPLVSKVVDTDTGGSGVDFDFMGLSDYISPFHFKFGSFWSRLKTVPTSDKQIYTAAYNRTAHQDFSMIQHASDENVSTTTNLPEQAYVGPNVQVLSPISDQAAIVTNRIASTNSVAK